MTVSDSITLDSILSQSLLLSSKQAILQQVKPLLKNDTGLVSAYLKLAYFKPYRDYYGECKGEQIIDAFSTIMRNSMSENEQCFALDHETFVLIAHREDWLTLCERIQLQFAEWARHRYPAEAQVMGAIAIVAEDGHKQFYPLLTVNVGKLELSRTITSLMAH